MSDDVGVAKKDAAFLSAQREEFMDLCSVGDVGSVMMKAMSGGLRNSRVRSLCWKLLLGVIDTAQKPTEWVTSLSARRQEYVKTRDHHTVDPHKQLHEQELDLSIHNPLSTAVDNAWSKYFQNGELEKTIEQDLKRLFPEYEFFQDKTIQETMKTVLFVWSLDNPEYSYRQGMHEVLAPIALAVSRDAYKRLVPAHQIILLSLSCSRW
eukprot:GEZU01015441.1.p1 GENE.GEZU01015441.1~~GEZU01015441.1.p1  ORF type:complete len:208 (+),score=24.35 GEZU01015441.1:130-753(+)